MNKRISPKVTGIIVFLIIMFIIIGIIVSFSSGGDNVNKSLADGFNISAYNIILDVNENNTIDVTEKITVNFTSNTKKGILKFIPEWLEYTGKDEETIKRKSIVTNLRAIGDEYTIDTVKNKKRIKIGSANEYVDLGEKTYIIKYNYNMGKDPYDGFDEFIFHAFGDYWGAEIKNASIEVNMPKKINITNVNFFMDKYRNENANDFVDYSISGNTIYASFNQNKYLEYQKSNNTSHTYLTESLTIDIELPEGYFIDESWNYGYGSLIICLIIFGITIWNFINWRKYGKDFPKMTETMEFYPPENYTAAEIGYIYGKQVNKRLTISLIVQLACKGYIKIDEIEKNNKKEIQITNLIIKPADQLKFSVSNRIIKVKKIKLADPSILNKDELTMMTYLFSNGDEKELKTNIENFLKVKDSLIQKGFIEIISDNDNTIKSVIYNKQIENMPSLSELELIVYNSLFESKNVIILSEHKTFYSAFNSVNISLKSKLKNLINDKNATAKMIKSIVLSVLVLTLYLISYSNIEDMNPNWSFIYNIAFVCIFINIFFTIIMKRRTKYGQEIFAKIKGFRNFLLTAEKDKLENLVLENPNYFYNILPYAYVLNISKKWIEKFENIQVQKIDIGNYNFSKNGSIDNLYNDIYYPSSSGGSSGCSSCGGGCSSCGGGCSSCGGGGSW